MTTRRRLALPLAMLVATGCRAPHGPPPPAPPAHPIVPVVTTVPPVAPDAAWTSSLIVPVAGSSVPLEVTVHVPAHLDRSRPVYAMVFFHASGVCAAQSVWAGEFDQVLCHRRPGRGMGWGFAALHDTAHTNTVLVVPQLHTGRDGALSQPAGFPAMLDAVARHVGTHLDPAGPPLAFAGTVLGAHSLGGIKLQRVLTRSAVARDVRAVLLFDALGDRVDVILSWWRSPGDVAHRRLLMVYAGVVAAERLARGVVAATRHHAPGSVVTRVGDLTRDLATHPIVAMESNLPHGDVEFIYFVKALAALGLPLRDVSEPWESPVPHAAVAVTLDERVDGRLIPPDAIEGEARRSRDYTLTVPPGTCVEVTLIGGPAPWAPFGRLDTRLQLFVGGQRVVDDDDGVRADERGRERFDSRARWCATTTPTALVARASDRLENWAGGAFTLQTRSSVASGTPAPTPTP